MLSYSDKLNVTINETSCRPLASAVTGKKLLFPWTDFVERMTVKCSNFPTIVSQGTTCLPMNGSILAEIYLDELSESTGVIVVYCLRIAKSLKNKGAEINICTICIVTIGIYNASYILVKLLVYIYKFTFLLESTVRIPGSRQDSYVFLYTVYHKAWN